MDLHFFLASLDGNFSWVVYILSCLPIPRVRYFLAATQRMIEVSYNPGPSPLRSFTDIIQYGKIAFYNYISTNGRKSTRKDLLTKILSGSSDVDHGQLTDLEIYVEIASLIFAGTGTYQEYRVWIFADCGRYD